MSRACLAELSWATRRLERHPDGHFFSGFCLGVAETQTGDPLALYPQAEVNAKAVRRNYELLQIGGGSGEGVPVAERRKQWASVRGSASADGEELRRLAASEWQCEYHFAEPEAHPETTALFVLAVDADEVILFL